MPERTLPNPERIDGLRRVLGLVLRAVLAAPVALSASACSSGGNPCQPTLSNANCSGVVVPASCISGPLPGPGTTTTQAQCESWCGSSVSSCSVVGGDGGAEVVCYGSCATNGRRPAGFSLPRARGPLLGRYFADAAYLEAASIRGFRESFAGSLLPMALPCASCGQRRRRGPTRCGTRARHGGSPVVTAAAQSRCARFARRRETRGRRGCRERSRGPSRRSPRRTRSRVASARHSARSWRCIKRCAQRIQACAWP